MNDILDEDLLEKDYQIKFKAWPIYIWLFILFIGILFYIMHWPGSSIMMIVPSAVLTAYTLSGLIRLKGKSTLNNVLTVLAIIWFLFFIWGMIFNNGHPFNLYGIAIYGSTVIVSFIFYEIIFRLKKRSAHKTKSSDNLLS
jgi:uncharacterized membrane protein YGL010W